MDTKKILIPQDVAQEGKNYLVENGYEIKMGSGTSENNLIQDVVDCEAILLRTAQCTKKVLEAGKNLKIVARHGAGFDNVDLKAANELGIWVTNTPDATTNSVAEFTIGAIIAAAKRTFAMSCALHDGRFFYKTDHKGIDLAGKTLSILGLGRIGRAVAKKAYFGLDMKIIAYDPFAKNIPEYIQLTDRDNAFRNADVVSLHMPMTAENSKSVGKKEFELMKNTAYLVNCARGELVDEDALTSAIQNRDIAGAFIDVYFQEPPSMDNPLLSLENVTATPHMASNTTECMALMSFQAASQIHKVLSGQKPDWPVNRPKF